MIGIEYIIRTSVVNNGKEYECGDPLIFNHLYDAWKYLETVYDSYFHEDNPDLYEVRKFVGIKKDELRIGIDENNCVLYKIQQAIYTNMNYE